MREMVLECVMHATVQLKSAHSSSFQLLFLDFVLSRRLNVLQFDKMVVAAFILFDADQHRIAVHLCRSNLQSSLSVWLK